MVLSWQEILLNHMVSWGFPHLVSYFLSVIAIVVVVALLAFIFDLCFRKCFLSILGKLANKSENRLDDQIIASDAVRYFSDFLPAWVAYCCIPKAFPSGTLLMVWGRKVIIIYSILLAYLIISSIISVLEKACLKKYGVKALLFRLVSQIIRIAFLVVAVVCMISVFIDESPVVLLTGLGASAALMSLIFKDTIAGFVAGIMLSSNNMLRRGDWITIDKQNVDGVVEDISLHTVKIVNFDKSVVTIPPSMLINSSFINWRKMQKEGARRINRTVYIDFDTVRSFSPEDLNGLKDLPYAASLVEQVEKNNHRMPDGSYVTNVALFKEYLSILVSNHPRLVRNDKYVSLVRQLEATDCGFPLQCMFFVDETDWEKFENIQFAFFNNVYALLPNFSLRCFQRAHMK